jgi:uncharacterized protein (DUF1499 family)
MVAGVFISLGLLVAAVLAIQVGFGQPFGFFAGRQPADLGLINGRFKACPASPNCVSSHSDSSDAVHFVAPLPFAIAPEQAMQLLRDHLKTLPRLTFVAEGGGYLRAEFKSERLGFVDDFEAFADAARSLIYVRSASRLGRRDFGVNRARVEAIRAALAPSMTPKAPARKVVPLDFDKLPDAKP